MAKEKKNRFFIRFNKAKKAYQICDSTVRPGLDVIALVSGLANAEWICKDLNSHDELLARLFLITEYIRLNREYIPTLIL